MPSRNVRLDLYRNRLFSRQRERCTASGKRAKAPRTAPCNAARRSTAKFPEASSTLARPRSSANRTWSSARLRAREMVALAWARCSRRSLDRRVRVALTINARFVGPISVMRESSSVKAERKALPSSGAASPAALASSDTFTSPTETPGRPGGRALAGLAPTVAASSSPVRDARMLRGARCGRCERCERCDMTAPGRWGPRWVTAAARAGQISAASRGGTYLSPQLTSSSSTLARARVYAEPRRKSCLPASRAAKTPKSWRP
jgi:hypothetical protein